jgi:hypothetical protein
LIKNKNMLVAHTCNPSYSGSRDQEDLGSKPAWANSRPVLKNASQKGLAEWVKVEVLVQTPVLPKNNKIK